MISVVVILTDFLKGRYGFECALLHASGMIEEWYYRGELHCDSGPAATYDYLSKCEWWTRGVFQYEEYFFLANEVRALRKKSRLSFGLLQQAIHGQ